MNCDELFDEEEDCEEDELDNDYNGLLADRVESEYTEAPCAILVVLEKNLDIDFVEKCLLPAIRIMAGVTSVQFVGDAKETETAWAYDNARNAISHELECKLNECLVILHPYLSGILKTCS